MFSRILAAIAVIFVVSGCQSTKNASDQAANGLSGVDGFYVRSGNLEPFTPLEGDEAGAKAHDRVFFAYDSSVIDDRGQGTLDRQAKWLKDHASQNVTVEGHCDERGTREYNLALGERRAQAVKNYLVGAGVNSSRIKTVSYGKERPAIVGSDEEAFSQNRRGVTVLN